MRRTMTTLCAGLCTLFIFAQTNIPTTDFIKVDQFGYLPNGAKIAVISNPQIGFNGSQNFTAGATYQVRNWQTGAVVFSGSPQVWSSGATHDQSGDKGWWFDFSTLTTSGSYYIYDVNNNVRSYQFDIDANVYSQVLYAAMRMFFYNRCNFAKQAPYAEPGFTDGIAFTNNGQDANCRYIHDQNNPATEKDLTGGWFDAGDFNKYVTFADGAMHDLLSAYEENPQAFGDNFNIPESGNGIPDVLDEIKWELDWLLKMNNANGSTHIKMGSTGYGENVLVPPSVNTDPRFYGPVCSSASISVAGVFAHAALIMEQIPALSTYAQTLRSRAISSWNYVLPKLNNNTLDTACDLGEIVAGDADWDVPFQRKVAIRTAIYLYALTGNNAYNQYIINNIYNDAPNQTVNYYWDVYEQPLNDALLLYAQLSNANQSIANTITSVFQAAVSNPANGYYGFNSSDLYRAYMPTSAYHWGSSIPKAGYGILNTMAANSNVYPAGNSGFNLKAAEQLHYFHGVNPLNLVYLSNMGNYGAEKSCNEIYHNWFAPGSNWDNAQSSLYGPAPGYVPGGPNKDFSLGSPSPPAGQPAQKSYLDFNDGYPINSWEITEPAIYYQARYVRLLANFSGAPISCPVVGTACDDGNPNTENDIENGFCACEGTSTQPEVCNLVLNGNFDDPLSSEWYWWGSDASITANSISISNINGTGSPWDAAFAQSDFIYEQGKAYTISFTASAAANRSIYVKTSSFSDPYTSYVYESVNLTTIPQVYTVNFVMTNSTTLSGTLEFYIGESNASIVLDNISLKADDCDDGTCPLAGTICDDGDTNTINDIEDGNCNCSGTPLPDTGCDLIVNGNFNDGLNGGWYWWGSDVSTNSNQANITNIGSSGNPWDAAFAQSNMVFEQGQSYLISFDAIASMGRSLYVKTSSFANPFNSYLYQDVVITNSYQNYEVNFTMSNPTIIDGTLEFYVGESNVDLSLDNISIRKVGCNDGNCPIAGTPCDDGDTSTTNDTEDGNCNCSGTPVSTGGGDCNQIENGTFDTNLDNWSWWGCSPTPSFGFCYIGGIIPGVDPWDAGVKQENMTLEQGKQYEVTFDAFAANNRNITIKIGLPVAPFTNHHFEEISLSTSTQNFSFTFTMNDPSTTQTNLEILVGRFSGDVILDNVMFSEVGCTADNCQSNLTIEGTANNFLYEASNLINSNANINTNADVHFHAGNRIKLENNFRVPKAATFRAAIEPCGTSPD